MVGCGIGACAASKAACVGSIVNMVLSSIASVVSIAAIVVSFGTASAATPAITKSANAVGMNTLKAAARAAKIALKTGTNWVRAKGTQFAIDAAKGAITAKFIAEYCSLIYKTIENKAGDENKMTKDDVINSMDVFGLVDTVKACKSNDALECSKGVISVLSTFDPTGLLGVAASFMHPKCNWVKPVTPVNIVYGDPATAQRAYIVGASYGKLDVTSKIIKLYDEGNFKIMASNALGDGWYGIRKTLVVVFHYMGKFHTLYAVEGGYV
jgi:hypothetical protein